MSAEHQARLAGIGRGPWRQASQLARATIPRMQPAAASRYFRFHDVTITDPQEIEFRESFDEALEELQLLELAVMCGYLPLEIVEPEARAAFATLLATPQARKYLSNYDYLLVRFLAARLREDLRLPPVTPPPVEPSAAIRYAAFLAVHMDFAQSSAIEKFTRLLDDYHYGRVNAALVKRGLAGIPPELSSAEQQHYDEALVGFFEFLQLLGDLFVDMQPDHLPLFGSNYGYWLGRFFGMRRKGATYDSSGISFGDLRIADAFFPASVHAEIRRAEQERANTQIAVLRETWRATRALLESSSG
jgi:hypothetical protein